MIKVKQQATVQLSVQEPRRTINDKKYRYNIAEKQEEKVIEVAQNNQIYAKKMVARSRSPSPHLPAFS